jgi:uncharacterized protein (DUF488 family)
LRDEASVRPTIFTIGHSNHPVDKFIGLLQANGIEAVVDTRSKPYSRYAGQFNREALQASIASAGMKYVYLGRELGGKPEEAAFYDAKGQVLYARLAASAPFAEGIERVLAGSERYRIALLCAEEDPRRCHRHLLLAPVLAERGAIIQHIRAGGRLQPEEELLAERHEKAHLPLFDRIE